MYNCGHTRLRDHLDPNVKINKLVPGSRRRLQQDLIVACYHNSSQIYIRDSDHTIHEMANE